MLAKFLANGLKSVSNEDIIQKFASEKLNNEKFDEKKITRKKKVTKKRNGPRPKSPPPQTLIKAPRLSQHNSMNPMEVSHFENILMKAAEIEQTGVDKFWGLELEESFRKKELELMTMEDLRSKNHEFYSKTIELISNWEEDEFFSQQKSALQSSLTESLTQQNYLKSIYEGKLYDISTYQWNPQSTVNGSQLNCLSQKIDDNFLRSLHSIESQIGFPVESSTIHTDSLLKSQSIPQNFKNNLNKDSNTNSKGDSSRQNIGKNIFIIYFYFFKCIFQSFFFNL